jgi:hypothetical protein
MVAEIMAEPQQLQQELVIPAVAVVVVDIHLVEPLLAEKVDLG